MDKIHLIKNVLADDERKKLIEDSIPLLKNEKQLSDNFKNVSKDIFFYGVASVVGPNITYNKG